ncbi:Exo-alpha-sialidase [Pedobacter heparinus DSM 2366]|uniref:exo-alpha-sialidase n=1 Tax=Pedobacter heparinus (strain ATCC 13125 / DSM 2366 / CIP 104194 / JCM 7457 / NBRC 12017 / NCIMB 9290 / NRRL B-14731 / HIM 762-3) TaxID=485917 RepID=C6XY09_PEDHD|nr:Exo-alpha-sialidase [Pedobacter heparinus DSM 2366]
MLIFTRAHHKLFALETALFFITICFFLTFITTGCKTTKQNISRSGLDSTLVFTPDKTYTSMRIPALVITQKGTLLAFCEGRIGTASDWADMDLLMRRSTNGGKTWEPHVIIAAKKTGEPTSNATPIVDKDGTIHLLYQRDYARAYYTFSKDDGKTWSKAADITYAFDAFKPEYDWKVLAPGPGHSIQLKNGRLLVPVWLSNPAKMLPRRSHAPSCIATIYSDDLGHTWKRGAIIADNNPDFKNPSETMAIQLKDGRVMVNIRNVTEKHRRGLSYSKDGISGWSKPVFDEELFEPVCMATITRLPEKLGGGMLFINPDSRDIPKYPRKNLTARISNDEGQSWPVKKVIDTGTSGYSDVAVGADGTIYCLYETNSNPGRNFNYSLVLKRFSLNWLTGTSKK